MKIQYLSRFIRLTKELGLENQGQIMEFFKREQNDGESVFDTLNRYYRLYLGVQCDNK